MLLDVNINGESLEVEITDPFSYDLEGIHCRISEFASSRGVRLGGADIKGLIPRLVRGIAGCEGGCPADAHTLVARGYKSFRLAYVDGGILVAEAPLGGEASLVLRMFPDF